IGIELIVKFAESFRGRVAVKYLRFAMLVLAVIERELYAFDRRVHIAKTAVRSKVVLTSRDGWYTLLGVFGLDRNAVAVAVVVVVGGKKTFLRTMTKTAAAVLDT